MARTRDYPRERYNAQQDKQTRLIERMRSIYHWSELLGQSFDTELRAIQEWRELMRQSKLPAWRKAYIEGRRDELRERIYREKQEWRLCYRAQLVTSEDIPAGEWHNVASGAHVWKHDPTRVYSWADEAFASMYQSYAYPALDELT